MPVKTEQVHLTYVGWGQYRVDYDPKLGRDYDRIEISQQGPYPTDATGKTVDGWWPEQYLSKIRVQRRDGKAIITALGIGVQPFAPSILLEVSVW